MQKGAQQRFDLLPKFGLQMHVGTHQWKSKTKALYAPPSLEKARANPDLPGPLTLNQEETISTLSKNSCTWDPSSLQASPKVQK